MNVLRMIKFFAWESKMEERIKEKRTEELGWIKKKIFMDLLNGMLKYALVHWFIHCLISSTQLPHPSFNYALNICNIPKSSGLSALTF
jgi:hypothetical protein